jgi:integrase
MPGKIKNPYYKAFLEGHLLQEIDRDDLKFVLDRIQHQYVDQARCMVIVLWVTGARPNEVLKLTGKNFVFTKDYLEIQLNKSKGGMARDLGMPWINPKTGQEDELTKEVWEYAKTMWLDQYCFHFFRSEAKRYGVKKTYRKKNGEVIEKFYDKVYDELSSKLRYYIPKWFSVLWPEGIPPYYLRHNRGSKLYNKSGGEATTIALGHTSEKTKASYAHQTKDMRKNISRGIME